MKKLSDTLKKLGIAFTFPIKINDAKGNETYYEDSEGCWRKYEYNSKGDGTYYEGSTGYWWRCEYDAKGNLTYYEDSEGFWIRREYDAKGNETYFENSYGEKRITHRSQSCAVKIVEVDGKKYKLTEL